MSKYYSQEFKDKMLSKLLHPSGPSVLQWSRESGIAKSTLYKWLAQSNHQAEDTLKTDLNQPNPTVKG